MFEVSFSYYSLFNSLTYISVRYDIPLLQAVQAAVTVPVIASSGAGKGVSCTAHMLTTAFNCCCCRYYCSSHYTAMSSVLSYLSSLTLFQHHPPLLTSSYPPFQSLILSYSLHSQLPTSLKCFKPLTYLQLWQRVCSTGERSLSGK